MNFNWVTYLPYACTAAPFLLGAVLVVEWLGERRIKRHDEQQRLDALAFGDTQECPMVPQEPIAQWERELLELPPLPAAPRRVNGSMP